MDKKVAVDATSCARKLSRTDAEILKGLLRQIIYDFLICLENARIALHFLLEKGTFHRDWIFTCLLSEIRAFEFINEQQNVSGYIKRRLAFRLKASFSKEADSAEGSNDIHEQYSHPAFDDAVRKLCRFYDLYYEGRPESTVIHLLCGRVSPIDAEIGLAIRAEAPVA
jgi:hypothetical protein